jgi:hypothetical protein
MAPALSPSEHAPGVESLVHYMSLHRLAGADTLHLSVGSTPQSLNYHYVIVQAHRGEGHLLDQDSLHHDTSTPANRVCMHCILPHSSSDAALASLQLPFGDWRQQ